MAKAQGSQRAVVVGINDSALDFSWPAGQPFCVTAAEKRRAERRLHWKLEVVSDFAEAEANTRAYWHAASPAERLNGLEMLRQQLYGPGKSSPRLQRFLELVPQA